MKGHKVTDLSKPVSAQIRVNGENSFFYFCQKWPKNVVMMTI